MKHIYKLDESDIRNIIAEYFNVDKNQVVVITGMRSAGYGMDARDEPYVIAEVDLKEENK